MPCSTPLLALQCIKEPEKPLYGGGIISAADSSGKKCPIKGSVLKVDLKKDYHYALSGNRHSYTLSNSFIHEIVLVISQPPGVEDDAANTSMFSQFG